MTLKVLKIAENDLKSEGAIPIIKASGNLETLVLSKNYMKSDCGKCLQDLLKGTTKLKKLQIDFNELMVQGA